MNVFDWLNTLPLPANKKAFNIVEVTFNRGSRKEFYKNGTQQTLSQGDWITVESSVGNDMGQVNLTGDLVRLQMKKYGVSDTANLKRILRLSSQEEIEEYHLHKQTEMEVLARSRAIARQHRVEMKISEVEMQADGKKATFYYTAENRVDFRELIRIYASEFKTRVDMKQIGARQESGKIGGIGSCGRELCCSTWLTDFKSVNTTAARYQNLSINQTKLSGQCGRLKCCLNYELDTYMDALRAFPDKADVLLTAKGKAYLQKRDIFKNLMWYVYGGSTKQYPLRIEQVVEILEQNKNGQKPDDLVPVELEVIVSGRKFGTKETLGFVNDVGQENFKSLEKASRRKAQQKKGGAATNRGRDQRQASSDTGEGRNNRGARKPQHAKGRSADTVSNTGRREGAPDPNTRNDRRTNPDGRNEGNRNRSNRGPRPDRDAATKKPEDPSPQA